MNVGTRRTRIGGTLALLCVLVSAGTLRGLAPARAEEDPREAALRAQLYTLETLLQRIDNRRAASGSYGTRIVDLNERLTPFEARFRLRRGPLGTRGDFGTLLLQVNSLGLRARAVLLSLIEQAAPPKDAPDQGLFVPAPVETSGAAPPSLPPPTGPSAAKGLKWPETLSFNATGKLNFRETGQWLLGPNVRSGWGPDFLQTGTSGSVAVSIRARNLPREVRSADLRVVVHLGGPFAPRGGVRVFDLTWQSERTLSNQALKTWMAADRLTIPGPYRWIDGPDEVSRPVDVEAHVTSVTLHDGSVFHFFAPDFVPLPPSAPPGPPGPPGPR